MLLRQFLVLAITTGKKKFQSSVWRVVLLHQFLVLAITTGKKKVPVVCLAGCAVASVFGSGDYNRKKKFQSSVWWVVLLRQFQLELKLIQKSLSLSD